MKGAWRMAQRGKLKYRNIEHRMMNVNEGWMFIVFIRCWTFNVRCSMFPALAGFNVNFYNCRKGL
jgi:hypothetical protein